MENKSFKRTQRNWTREEIILALELYCIIPKGQDTVHNKSIIALAKAINRTPDSIKFKLQNFKSYDPSYTYNGRTGLSHGSQLDEKICNEFFQNWEALIVETDNIKIGLDLPRLVEINDYTIKSPLGNDVEKIRKERIGQSFFRCALLAAYNGKCCVTGISIPELLRASHIKPWSKCNANEKTNPQNGLLLNALHDAAFDNGYMTISSDYKIIVSKKLLTKGSSGRAFFEKYHEQKIILPSRFLPEEQFIKYHNKYKFKEE
ncbi:MAG: HNH endonuclease [Fibromonadales bacterium]|nr:HNH endonuclease [Fibromonadales bacterium]